MKLIGLTTLFLTINLQLPVYGQPAIHRVKVSESALRNHVFALTADSLEGRATGTIGQSRAALYCTQSFRRSHLQAAFRLDSIHGSFRQAYPFRSYEVANFGSRRSSLFVPSIYRKYELAPLPLTEGDSSRVLFGHNVGGVLIGTDLKQEVVVISAHYDHLGKFDKRIYHGADDNGSGTSAVLSIATVFDSLAQQGIKPRRSLLFVLFSGEEAGLLGSQFFVQHSPIARSQLVCNLNVDMIGRIDYDHRKKPDYCYLISGKQVNKLQDIVKSTNQQSVQLILNQGGYNAENDPEQYFYRSDQYSFARVGIPALLFTSGNHPDYHQSSDTADRIAYDVLQKRATLVFQTAWRLANPAP